ncbi:Xaa-Pro dipeptidyl-peptidase [Companilactobacillus ginsenosidimutans]|uniref:Xaa-Pro dipeptidyl-peptidase n=1 Tax=Companilactobacillus ginsenosidimutans TaxID=1007676 RepID=A0A0H4QK07_9LACO|nr:Xaa-Pro dipeptidyl-peptidase [Companilactobacillus ginsenosidimutans]AKP66983.1 x-prolyl-dipeptidyl aminopeptidase [Companilactobacillus ginsenosidimutans]
MLNNQFAIKPTDYQTQLNELHDIHFIDTDNEDESNPIKLWKNFLRKSFLDSNSDSVFSQKLSTLMATPDVNLNSYLEENSRLNIAAFYNVALQLLGFPPDIDFSFADPLEGMKKIQLKIVDHQDKFLTVDELKSAWYWLLATHNKDGQTYLDSLAAQGYFVSFYDDETVQKPLLFNGKTLPVFNPHRLIREVVYVESPQDTDHDGKLDLLKVEILRPAESNNGLKVPTLYTASPYNQGTNDETGDRLMHNVNIPLTHKNPDTNKYADIEYTDSESTLPAARPVKGTSESTEETFAREQSYTLNDYFLARGFGVAYAAGIGTKDSDGVRTTGDPEETVSTISVIEWLAGNRRAFTNKIDNIAIKADWSNKHVAMTGRSYLGTLATAAATTGVEGLKAILCEAAISSWYDYYRDGGLVIAPGGFPGEDADVLAEETFSRRLQAGDYHKVKTTWDNQLKSITEGQDRATGNYNTFWDARNYRKNAKNIKADVMFVHGLNDWNVKPRNVERLWNDIAGNDISKKIILHQGQHIYINAFRSIDFTDIANLWLTNELWDVDNGAQKLLPNVIVQDNVKSETWNSYSSWSNKQNAEKNYYLSEDTLRPTKEPTSDIQIFSDKLPENIFANYCKNIDKWQNDLVTENNNSLKKNRLIFKSDRLSSELLLDGTPKINLRIASDQNIGMLSFQVIDYGISKRLNVSPSILKAKGLAETYDWREDDLREFQISHKPSEYKMITKGHINLQNRKNNYHVQEISPNKFYDISVELQPTMYRLIEGHQLGLVIYATDFGMTIRGNQNINYSVDPKYSSLVVPFHSAK